VATGYDIGTPAPLGSTDLNKLRAGAVDAVFFAAYVPKRYAASGSAAYCRRIIDAIRNGIVARHPSEFVLARTADDIVSASKQGKIAALIGIEGGHAIEDSLDKLREYHALGVRYMTLTHSNTNNWADSSGDKPRHGGLSQFGEQVVAEMNRLGMVVDVSHVSDETFDDVMRTSKAPVIASHSSCRAISRSRRNMTDDMLRKLAKNGGVIQINFACDFLNERSRTTNQTAKKALQRRFGDNLDALRAESEKRFARASLADVIAHIDHAVKVAGIDHVGIGSDFDGIDCTPIGLEDNSKFPALTQRLLQRGYTADQIHKIYGGNTLRVMRATENMARVR
ncbi:MAG TPA: dipeptidase, partial [Bryobacteraceae bacterium]|nr:dipeptidase [Bryobacteraceae bacterium]